MSLPLKGVLSIMKNMIITFGAAFLLMALFPLGSLAQSDDIKLRVNDLVLKHYMDGIPYAKAHALGSDALSHLFELLNDSDEKMYWTNIIVTIGFVEDALAVEPLTDFLDKTEGDVDGATFRALLSVPYALGCIASAGGSDSLNYLTATVQPPQNLSFSWSYRGKDVAELIAEQSVMALAVSGRPEARSVLQNIKAQQAQTSSSQIKRDWHSNIDLGLTLMDRIANEGRAAVLNPQHEN